MSTTIGPYLEQQIQSADPLNLICLYYRHAIQAVRDARAFLIAKNIAERSRSISLAHGILAELYRSLDFQQGGDLAQELGRLYDYMMRRLIEANSKQIEEPLEDVQKLMTTLSESWEAVAQKASALAPVSPEEMPSANPWGMMPGGVAEFQEHSYSF